MAKRVIITRPKEDSETVAASLASHGYIPIIEPVTSIAYAADVDAKLLPYIAESAILLATSRHAALAPHGCPSYIPWIVSGNATVLALKRRGCGNITLAGQTAEALRDYLAKRPPDILPYVYLTGAHRTLNLAEELAPLGYQLHTVEAYEAKAHQTFSKKFLTAWKEQPAQAVLFYSSRHAGIFEQLVKQEGLEPTLAKTEAFCLSEQVGSTLALPWKSIHASKNPATEDLIALLNAS